MKINKKVFSLPPYISTHWANVSALHMRGTTLVVSLIDGELIEIPGLDQGLVKNIFDSHTAFIEQDGSCTCACSNLDLPQSQFKYISPFSQIIAVPPEHRVDIPFRIGIGSFDDLTASMQHNPHQASAPDLPAEILQKIIAITKIVAPEEALAIPKPEQNCNCIYCQIARAMHPVTQEAEAVSVKREIQQPAEEAVSDLDLQFQQWEITQTGNKLFTVINRLDTNERYSVYLGQPVGCTCGKEGCEHIVAVLKS